MIKKCLAVVAALFLFGCTNHLSDSDLEKIHANLEVVDLKQDYNYGDRVNFRVTLINNSDKELHALFSMALGAYFDINNADGEHAFVDSNPSDPSSSGIIIDPGETRVFNQWEDLGVKNLNNGLVEDRTVHSNLTYGNNIIHATFRFIDYGNKIGQYKYKINTVDSNSIDLNILKDEIKR